MCTRYSLTAELPELASAFGLDRVEMCYGRRFNIAPRQQVAVIQQIGEERCLRQHRWGLVPFWAKDSVNAERDTLRGKPFLHKLLSKKRCVIPCSGIYTWRTEGKIRQPWRIVRRDNAVFGMAGIYEIWRDPRKNDSYMCTVITTPSASEPGLQLPYILDEAGMAAWLNPKETRIDTLLGLLRRLPEAELRSYPVSRRIDNVELESLELIEELHPAMPMVK
ncbi:SOS response-associated peptidase [Paenibacillus cymbidii]|uniref:SOS response-associated peptidase n=1 Tax=Paenibacillus cymbidii TaxID=1639034 RepID=UPI001436B522|nr:SOS response-associated peptidase [Paenibacillus cymbidii]